MRDVRNNEKEGGQTNESLKTSAAHAADAAGDVVAADWEEAGSHRGGAGRERDRERGAALRPLWAREPTLPLGATRPPRPRAGVNSPGLPERSLQTSSRRGVPGVGGRRAAAATEPQPRPAPRPSAAHLGQVYDGAPLAPRRSCPPRPRGPGLAGRPHLRGRERPSPARPLARPPARPAAPARLTHIAPQLLLGRRFPQPARAHHVVAAAAHGRRPSGARRRLARGQGRGLLGQPAAGAQLAGEGRGRAAPGEDEAALSAGPAACACSIHPPHRARARSPSTPPHRARTLTDKASPTRAPRQAAARHAHSPAGSPRSAGAEANSPGFGPCRPAGLEARRAVASRCVLRILAGLFFFVLFCFFSQA